MKREVPRSPRRSLLGSGRGSGRAHPKRERSSWRRAAFLAPWLLLALSACPTDCERACGKFTFCGLLPQLDQATCVSRCEEEPSASNDDRRLCGDCAEQNSCRAIADAVCDKPCELIFGPVEEGGAGGQGGAEGN